MLGFGNLLIVYCDYGRLGNRLHTHANALAWCIENNYNLINLSFNEYAPLFKSSSKHKSGIFIKPTAYYSNHSLVVYLETF